MRLVSRSSARVDEPFSDSARFPFYIILIHIRFDFRTHTMGGVMDSAES